MKHSFSLIAMLALLIRVSETLAQGTAFTYHGRLQNNGAPVNGPHDLRFSIHDANAGGQVVAGPLAADNVAVADGLFTMRLEFGAGVFTGAPRWLEISVRPAGNGDFQTLAPRQELTPSPYAIHAQTAGMAAEVSNGTVVKSVNGLKDNVTLAAGANVAITSNGNTLTIASTGGGGAGGGSSLWLLNGGNASYNAGNVGIGTTQPQGLLDLATGASDTSALFVRADPASYGRGGIIHHQSATYGWQELAQNTGSATEGFLTFHYVDRQAPGTKAKSDVLTLSASGRVGVGTTTPATRLTVYEPTSGHGIEHSDGTVRVGTYINRDGGWFGTYSNHKLHFFVNNGLSGAIIRGAAAKAGVEPPVIFEPPIDPPIVVEPPGGVEPPLLLARTPSMTIDSKGNVGVGTASPETKLHVVGEGMTEARIQAFGERAILGLHGFNRTWTLESGVGGQAGLFAIYDRGSGRARLTIDTAGVVEVGVLKINGGADLSENFDVRDAAQESEAAPELQPGLVVSIDPENAGKLTTSRQAYDRRVAGIISGAGGVKPGLLMGQDDSVASGSHPVALTGRVYAKADASFGAIVPGDLLTTSDTPGHAMKVSDYTQAQGAILGKAMSQLNEGQGLVLVLVTLQ